MESKLIDWHPADIIAGLRKKKGLQWPLSHAGMD